jgi:hypothetical protein
MSERILEQPLIDALKCGGSFTFVVRVRQKRVPGDFPYTSKVEEETRRDDIIEFDQNDIYNMEVQQELKEYMDENDVVLIKLNDKEVWHEKPKKYITLDSAYRVDG